MSTTKIRTSHQVLVNADLDVNNKKLINVANPTLASDVATKQYVDTVAQGLDVKQSVRCMAVSNIAVLSGLPTIDTINLNNDDRVLLRGQTNQSENGIWIVSNVSWTRALDFNIWEELPGAFVYVEDGTTGNRGTGWVCNVVSGGTLGTTPITFTQFSGTGTYVAGTGLLLTGTVFTVNYGTTANTVCAGNDPRLSDARTPLTHSLFSHPISSLTTGHFLKALGETAFGFAPHGLIANDVGAAPVNHASVSDIYGLGNYNSYGHLRVAENTGLLVNSGTLSLNQNLTLLSIALQGSFYKASAADEAAERTQFTLNFLINNTPNSISQFKLYRNGIFCIQNGDYILNTSNLDSTKIDRVTFLTPMRVDEVYYYEGYPI